jgi:hypothetical protein
LRSQLTKERRRQHVMQSLFRSPSLLVDADGMGEERAGGDKGVGADGGELMTDE